SCQMKIETLYKGKETKYFNGYPLIEEEEIYSQDHLKEGDIFQIVTDKSHYDATAYVGRQHKGLGWGLTYDNAQQIHTAFFVK
ncbi:SAM-dependent methyltransferase, partial [Staphylococcus aureus]